MNNTCPPQSSLSALFLALPFICPTLVTAQSYPVKPVRIVASNIGSPQDLLPRIIQPRLAEYLGQQILIEGRTGAGGVIAAGEVAKSAPDGYTLLSAADNLPVAHHLFKQVPYDELRAFAPITRLASAPPVLTANAAFQPRNLAEFIAYAKANPGKVSLGNSGNGTRGHIAAVVLASEAGLDLNHVPFKGAAQAALALLAGDINTAFVQPAAVVQNVRAGKLRAFAVASKGRHALLPDVPAVAESIPGFEAISWFGMLAPAKTPRDVITRLHRDITRAISQSEAKEKIAGMGLDVDTTTPEEFGAFINAESDRFGRVIRQYKITAD